jgi:hypothetical protein
MDLTQRMGVDWEQLRQAALAGQVAPIEQYASGMLASGGSNYRVVQRALEEFLFRQVRACLCPCAGQHVSEGAYSQGMT